jgi:hypothetical protein
LLLNRLREVIDLTAQLLVLREGLTDLVLGLEDLIQKAGLGCPGGLTLFCQGLDPLAQVGHALKEHLCDDWGALRKV